MKLSRLYCNLPAKFGPVAFNGVSNPLISVVFANITKPKEIKKDSHNLGKTTLIHVIDFLLLRQIASDREHFFLKHPDLFRPLVLFLEIQVSDDKYVTIRRSVDGQTRAAVKQHSNPEQDFTSLPDGDWDHWDLPVERAKQMLDGYLALTSIKPWDYRKGVSYFLRTQNDYRDYFQVDKFSRGRDVEWKPYLAHVVGLDSTLLETKYRLDDEIEKAEARKRERQSEVSVEERDYQRLLNEIAIQSGEVERIAQQMDLFSFDEQERRLTDDLVGRIEERISELNQELYRLSYDIQQIQRGLDTKLDFDLAAVKQVFDETRTYLPETLINDYDSLVKFNKKVTHERNTLLRSQLKALTVTKEERTREATDLDRERMAALTVLRERHTLTKFKGLQREQAKQMAQLELLKQQLGGLDRVREISRQLRDLERRRQEASDQIAEAVAAPNARYSGVAKEFNQLVRRVLDLRGSFYLRPNASGNVDFCIDTALPGSVSHVSSQADGTSYHKLLCALFDLAILRTYSSEPFYHFVYHDGILEGLDIRKRLLVLQVLRETASEFGIQCIITVIDSDLPRDQNDNRIEFDPSEIVLTLSDSGPRGRLFRMREF
jgi:uncharacterized protein YydD (DUF2326 family)